LKRTDALVKFENFGIIYDQTGQNIVKNINLSVPSGSSFCLAGESGCGKSLLTQAISGTLPLEMHTEGAIYLEGINLTSLSSRQMRAFWGKKFFYMPQEPCAAMDPSMKVMGQVYEIHRRLLHKNRREGMKCTRQILEKLGLDPDISGKSYPYQLSGGMNQRALLAMALSSPAKFIIVDEPTKGLDDAKRDDVILLISKLVEEGRTVFCITHDMNIPQKLGGTMAMMYGGLIVETGRVSEVINYPSHIYTKSFLKALPENGLEPIPDSVLASLGTAWQNTVWSSV
jgi:ABC-type glutathione transport system ATPase component